MVARVKRKFRTSTFRQPAYHLRRFRCSNLLLSMLKYALDLADYVVTCPADLLMDTALLAKDENQDTHYRAATMCCAIKWTARFCGNTEADGRLRPISD